MDNPGRFASSRMIQSLGFPPSMASDELPFFGSQTSVSKFRNHIRSLIEYFNYYEGLYNNFCPLGLWFFSLGWWLLLSRTGTMRLYFTCVFHRQPISLRTRASRADFGGDVAEGDLNSASYAELHWPRAISLTRATPRVSNSGH